MTRAIDDVDGVSADDDDASSSSSSSSEDEMRGLAGLIQRPAVSSASRAVNSTRTVSPSCPSPNPASPYLVLSTSRASRSTSSPAAQAHRRHGGRRDIGQRRHPDFRTPGTGLYDNLQKYNLPHPTAVFELDYSGNPNPSTYSPRSSTQEVLPRPHAPLHPAAAREGLLARCFTQNIDSLEAAAGIPADKIVAAHGISTPRTVSEDTPPT